MTTLHVSRAPPHVDELTTDRATASARNRDPSRRNLTVHPFAGRDLHYARSPTRVTSSVRFTSPTRRRARTRDERHIRGPGSSRVDDVTGRGIRRDLSRAATALGRCGDHRTWPTGTGATAARSQRVRTDRWPIHGAPSQPYPGPTGNGSAAVVATNPHRMSSVPRGHAGRRAGDQTSDDQVGPVTGEPGEGRRRPLVRHDALDQRCGPPPRCGGAPHASRASDPYG